MRIKIKTISFIVLVIFLFIICSPIKSRANGNDNNLNVEAKCAIAIDSKSKAVLYEKNAYMIVPMASTTKIMTALVGINYGNLDKKITISQKASGMRGSKVGYRKGEKVTLKELLYGLMLRSGNDASIAIAEGISGSVDEFVKIMNEYASSIGVMNTHFHTPHGLDYDDHYTTAYDLAIITARAKDNKLFNDIVSSKDIAAENYGFTRDYHNINKILWQIQEANGVKTGYTGKAGKCLVTSTKTENSDVIIVVLDCIGRWKETKKIYDYVIKNFEFKKIFSKDYVVGEINLKHRKIRLRCKEDIIVPIKKGYKYTVKILKPQEINSSVKKGDKLGSLQIYCDEKLIYNDCLESDDDYKSRKMSFPKIF